jgi:hypothetical protein
LIGKLNKKNQFVGELCEVEVIDVHEVLEAPEVHDFPRNWWFASSPFLISSMIFASFAATIF